MFACLNMLDAPFAGFRRPAIAFPRPAAGQVARSLIGRPSLAAAGTSIG